MAGEGGLGLARLRPVSDMAAYLAAVSGVALTYFILAKLGLTLASVNPSATPVWPPTGFALAALLIWGYRLSPAILIGAFAANATTAGTLATSAAIAVGNSLEAIVGKQDDVRIDLVLSDIVLPGINGRELARQAQALRPDLKILFMTGYSRNAVIHQGRLDPGVEMIQKPVTQATLAARIRDLLDAPTADA